MVGPGGGHGGGGHHQGGEAGVGQEEADEVDSKHDLQGDGQMVREVIEKTNGRIMKEILTGDNSLKLDIEIGLR